MCYPTSRSACPASSPCFVAACAAWCLRSVVPYRRAALTARLSQHVPRVASTRSRPPTLSCISSHDPARQETHRVLPISYVPYSVFACIFCPLHFVAIVESQEPTRIDLASPVGAQRPPFCHKLSSIAHQPKPLKKLTTSSISRDTAVYPLTTWPPPAALWAGPPASRTSHAGHKSPDRLRATGGVVR